MLHGGNNAYNNATVSCQFYNVLDHSVEVYIVNSSNKFVKNVLTAQYYPYQLERKYVLPDYNDEARIT